MIYSKNISNMINKTLSILDNFCKRNKLVYAITGTTAMALLGIPCTLLPGDIDIKIFSPTDEQMAKLKELRQLSGSENKKYPNNCGYSFLVNGVKVDAMIDDSETIEDFDAKNITLYSYNIETCTPRYIPVQKLDAALNAKMKLRREKDYKFMHNLIHKLTDL